MEPPYWEAPATRHPGQKDFGEELGPTLTPSGYRVSPFASGPQVLCHSVEIAI